jgi:hypothetical protein
MLQQSRSDASTNTIVIMVDNRNPIATDIYSAPYYSLATVINFEYAQRHGYAFKYYLTGLDHLSDPGINEMHSLDRQNVRSHFDIVLREKLNFYYDYLYANPRFYWGQGSNEIHLNHYGAFYNKLISFYNNTVYLKGRNALLSTPRSTVSNIKNKSQICCVHKYFAGRAAPWCKLPCTYNAINDQYDRVIYIDSDAIFNHPASSLDEFLHSSSSTLAPLQQASLILTFNYPWTSPEANSGFQIWRNTDSAKAMIQEWWNADAGGYSLKHSYEQYNLKTYLLQGHHGKFREHIAIIPTITFRERKDQYIRHVGSDESAYRTPRFRFALRHLKIGAQKFQDLLRQIENHHLIRFDTSQDCINSG